MIIEGIGLSRKSFLFLEYTKEQIPDDFARVSVLFILFFVVNWVLYQSESFA